MLLLKYMPRFWLSFENKFQFSHLNRDVWPQCDCFGAETAAPEDELLLLRDIFMTNLNSGNNDLTYNLPSFDEYFSLILNCIVWICLQSYLIPKHRAFKIQSNYTHIHIKWYTLYNLHPYHSLLSKLSYNIMNIFAHIWLLNAYIVKFGSEQKPSSRI